MTALSRRRALEEALDGDLDALAGEGVRDAGDLDDLVGDVARGELLADGPLDAVAEGVVEGGAVGEVDEERHPVAAVGLLDADDEGFADLGEAFDGLVDVGRTHAYALAVERGVGAAVDDDGAAVGEGDPVAVPPDAGDTSRSSCRGSGCRRGRSRSGSAWTAWGW